MELYKKLMNFKDTSDFKRFGFAPGGSNRSWLKKVEYLYRTTKKEMYGHLMTLGMHYVTSQGKETKITKKLRSLLP